MRRVSAVEELPEHVRRNRAHWDAMAPDWAELGRRRWAEEPSWGIWAIPETDIRLLPDDLAGMDAIELGCGTAYVSAWLARRGGRRPAAARLLRPAPAGVGGRRQRGVRAPVRRVVPAAALVRLRGHRPAGAAGAGRPGPRLPVRDRGVGATLAVGARLQGGQATLSRAGRAAYSGMRNPRIPADRGFPRCPGGQPPP